MWVGVVVLEIDYWNVHLLRVCTTPVTLISATYCVEPRSTTTQGSVSIDVLKTFRPVQELFNPSTTILEFPLDASWLLEYVVRFAAQLFTKTGVPDMRKWASQTALLLYLEQTRLKKIAKCSLETHFNGSVILKTTIADFLTVGVKLRNRSLRYYTYMCLGQSACIFFHLESFSINWLDSLMPSTKI